MAVLRVFAFQQTPSVTFGDSSLGEGALYGKENSHDNGS